MNSTESKSKQINAEYLFKRISAMNMSDRDKKNRLKHMTENNYKKILSYKDIHTGKRCFIIGGSPSLKLLDLSKLNNEYTFCVNRGYKLMEQGLKHSSYYVLADNHLIEEDKVMLDFPKSFCQKFFVDGSINFPDNIYDTTYFICAMKKEKFMPDLTQELVWGASTVHHAIQIAYYMGFNPIYMIGVDLDFNNISGHAYEELETEKQRQIKYSMREESVMRKAIANASEYIKEHNREIYNASPSGAVDCMPRVKYEELFQ